MSKAKAIRVVLGAACASALWLLGVGTGAEEEKDPACAAVEETDFVAVAACLSPGGVAGVPPSTPRLGDALDRVERFVGSFPEVEVMRIDRLWIVEEERS